MASENREWKEGLFLEDQHLYPLHVWSEKGSEKYSTKSARSSIRASPHVGSEKIAAMAFASEDGIPRTWGVKRARALRSALVVYPPRMGSGKHIGSLRLTSPLASLTHGE